jgi:hypothetical protein
MSSSRLMPIVLQMDAISVCTGVKSIMVFPIWALVG